LWVTLGVALASPGLLAEMYKWVDDEGQVQYSQSPPPGRPAQTIKPPPKVDSKAARDNLKQQLQDFEVRGDKRQEQAEADQKTHVFAAALGMCDRTSKSLSHPRSRGE